MPLHAHAGAHVHLFLSLISISPCPSLLTHLPQTRTYAHRHAHERTYAHAQARMHACMYAHMNARMHAGLCFMLTCWWAKVVKPLIVASCASVRLRGSASESSGRIDMSLPSGPQHQFCICTFQSYDLLDLYIVLRLCKMGGW